MKEKYIPKVGDKVRLLISESNFNEKMEKIIAKTPIVTVTKVWKNPDYPGEYDIDFDENQRNNTLSIKKNWQWTTKNNHFELVESVPIEEDLSYIEPLTQLVKNIKHV